jgi:trehalose 6-phosphate phosphatase
VRDILAASSRRLLARLAASDTLLAFDYDGTLAPIVDHPPSARVRGRTRDLLAGLSRAFPCAVISGRSRADVQRRLSGLPGIDVFGNHGCEEPTGDPTHHRARVRAWLPVLEHRLSALPGAVVEDKGLSLAIHYRHCRDRRQARRAIRRASALVDGVRVIGGKSVVNLVPRGAANKGAALAVALRRAGCDMALYIGDDETDEDVFALRDPVRLLTIRVGRKRTSGALFYIRDQERIDVLLATLLALRQTSGR